MDSPITPPKKRQLFKNRPAWARIDQNFSPAGSAESDPFSRSNEFLSNIADDEFEVKGKKKEKKKRVDEGEEKQAHPDAAEHAADGSARPAKSRRLTLNDEEGDQVLEGGSDDGDYVPATSKIAKRNRSEDHLTLTRRRGKEKAAGPAPPKDVELIALEDSGSEAHGLECRRRLHEQNKTTIITRRNAASVHVIDSDSDSDPPTQRHTLKSSNHEQNSANTTAQDEPDPYLSTPTPPGSFAANTALASRPAAAPPDPVLSLFIHSRIPNTKPLIVQRKLSQRLKEVRESWCGAQGFDAEQEAAVFLTWRGRRIFDISSCRSLGIVAVDEEGNVSIRADSKGKGRRPPTTTRSFNDSNDGDGDQVQACQIEMEAVTAEIMEADKRAREDNTADRAALSPTAMSPSRQRQDAAVRKPEGIKIILGAKGFEDYKLIVHPSTTFGNIVRVFCKQRGIALARSASSQTEESGELEGAAREAFLMFDGERLRDEDEVRSSDIGQMDRVEVYIR